MRPGRSWDVPDEFWRLWWGHRQLRKLIMQVDVEPAGKGPAGKRSAAEFQRQVMDQMESYRRYPMTGPVALDLHFRAARKNPPTVQGTRRKGRCTSRWGLTATTGAGGTTPPPTSATRSRKPTSTTTWPTAAGKASSPASEHLRPDRSRALSRADVEQLLTARTSASASGRSGACGTRPPRGRPRSSRSTSRTWTCPHTGRARLGYDRAHGGRPPAPESGPHASITRSRTSGGCAGAQGPPRLMSKIGSEEKLGRWLRTVCPVSVAIRLATGLPQPGNRDLPDIPTVGREDGWAS